MSYELPTLTDAEKSLQAIGWLGDSMRSAIQKMRKLERKFWKENGFIPGKEYSPVIRDVICLYFKSKNPYLSLSNNIYWERKVLSITDDCLVFEGNNGFKMNFIRRKCFVKIISRIKEANEPKNAKVCKSPNKTLAT